MPTPTRSTSETQLDQWNDQLRASPVWQQWMQSRGKIQGGRMVGLSDREQSEFERYLAKNGIRIPSGMHIDPGGNLNQKNRLARNIGIGAAIGGAALTGLGAAGIGPLSGAFGGGAATGGGAGVAAAPAVSSAMPAVGIAPGLAGYGLPASLIAENARGPVSPSDYLGTKPPSGGGRSRIGNEVANGAQRLNPLLQSAIAGLAGLPALMANRGPSDEERALMDEARQMNAAQRARISSQDPLFQAVTKLAMSRLPGSVQG